VRIATGTGYQYGKRQEEPMYHLDLMVLPDTGTGSRFIERGLHLVTVSLAFLPLNSSDLARRSNRGKNILTLIAVVIKLIGMVGPLLPFFSLVMFTS
jgi:hypothetical protein